MGIPELQSDWDTQFLDNLRKLLRFWNFCLSHSEGEMR